MVIDTAEIKNMPMDWFNVFNPFHTEEGLAHYRTTDQHYKILTWLANQYSGSTFWDVGTAFGASAVALAQNPDNQVVTFDPIPQVHEPLKTMFNNIKWSHKDLLEVPKFATMIYLPDLIVMDVDPHDGVWERRFLRWLRKLEYNGWMIVDDIYLNAGMRLMWDLIPERKYDLTHLGHFTGTGLVCFNDEPVEIC